jgi:phosphopantothenoylcysteine decarboxylase/phosphopantothenate--cysteine ligase
VDKSDFTGHRIVVTAGGTREPIDPVRYIGNRSSGKMGYSIAEAARNRGAKVTLITAPTALTDPTGMEVIYIESVTEMKEAVGKACAGADALIMAAAPADYVPKNPATRKIKKGAESLILELVKAPDILSEIKGDFLKIGFSAETEDLIENTRKKIIEKKCDLFVGNDVTQDGSGFGVDTNKVIFVDRNGNVEDMPLMTKREVAEMILDRVAGLLAD